MAFDMARFVTSGQAAEIANVGVARAVARAKALGLPVYGPVANDNAPPSPRHVGGLSVSERGIVSQVVHRHLEVETPKAGAKLRGTGVVEKRVASVHPDVLKAVNKKGYNRTA